LGEEIPKRLQKRVQHPWMNNGTKSGKKELFKPITWNPEKKGKLRPIFLFHRKQREKGGRGHAPCKKKRGGRIQHARTTAKGRYAGDRKPERGRSLHLPRPQVGEQPKRVKTVVGPDLPEGVRSSGVCLF